jgi:ribosomal protein L31
MQDLLAHKREKVEHKFISTITYNRKDVGCNEHGFYIGTTKNIERL